MKRLLVVAWSVVSLSAWADGDCAKPRPATKPELDFYAAAKALVATLPAAPKGWAQHPEEIVAPASFCTTDDPGFKDGTLRLSLTAVTEYRDPTDRSAKQEKAIAAGQPTAAEKKKADAATAKFDALTKEMVAAAGDQKKLEALNAKIAPVSAELKKLADAQLARGRAAMRAANFDAEARVTVSLNPGAESSTGCGAQKTLKTITVPGAAAAFSGTCDPDSDGDPAGGVLLLFGAWDAKAEGATLTATAKLDPAKPHTAVQAVSVLITGDGKRPDELLKGLDVKALAAAISN